MRLYQVHRNFYFSGWPDKETLQREKFDSVFTVCKKGLPEDLASLIGEAYHIPLTDGKDIPDFGRVAAHALLALEKGHKVLVHCYLGRNRSALVAALVYAYRQNVSKQEAFKHIKQLRPSAFYNKAFEEFLNDDLHNR